MIHYLASAAHSYPMSRFLSTWGQSVAERVEVHTYESLLAAGDLPAGTYIFADLERLNEPETQLAMWVWDRLAGAGPEVRLLNDPRRVLRRYELLRLLHTHGLNRFRAYRLTEERQPACFPVFLRRASEHWGSLTPLLYTQRELERAIWRLRLHRQPLADILMVEYCDTADRHGTFCKFDALVIGGEIIPCQLTFHREWMVKGNGEPLDTDRFRAERAFLEQNPHRSQLTRVAQLAHIDYGRIDYGLLSGQPQVWEINTNPIPILGPTPDRLPNQQLFAQRMVEALESLDLSSDGAPAIPLAIPARLRRRVGLSHMRRTVRRRVRGFGRTLAGYLHPAR